MLSALFIFAIVFTPTFASAATKRPTCELTVTTSAGETVIRKKADVLLPKGEEMTIAWESDNAKKAVDQKRKSIELSGEMEVSPTRDTTYKFSFTGDKSSRKVTCSVSVQVAEGSIDTSSLSTKSDKPTLSGEASGTKTVQVVVRKEGSTKPVFTSKHIKVKRGEWEVKSNKSLSDGTYSVELLAEKKWDLNTLDTASLTVGEETTTTSDSSAPSSNATLSVSGVPLLFGGTAVRGSSVPVAYLKVTNAGKSAATLNGITLKQNGSASASAITALEIRDDAGVSRGITSAKASSKGTLTASANIVLNPGQTRLFTVRATVGASAAAGSQLMLDVESISTNGKSSGKFPIRGTTFTVL